MPVIEVSHLSKRYGGRRVVDDVSCSVDEGEIFGVLGPNGAGKTTTVECVAGLRFRTAARSTCWAWTRTASPHTRDGARTRP
jgi:ABC-2 type transport system ATP-binding protein